MKVTVDEQQVRQDVADALHRVMHNHDIFRRILDVFFGNLDEHLAQLVEAHSQADRDRCVNLLHKLASGAKSIGAAELGAAFKQTEIATKDLTLPLFEVTLVEDLKQLALASQQAISKCFDG